MIIEIKEERLDEVVKYVYDLNKIKEHQCRPFKVDVVVSEIYDKFSDLILHDDDKLLVSVDDDLKINGVLGLFTELDDNYLQAFCGVYAHENYAEIGREFIEYLEEEHKGFKMMFAFPKENIEGIHLMGNNSFENIEDAVIYELTIPIEYSVLNEFIFDNKSILVEEVIKFYIEQQEDVYWTIDRILNDEGAWVMKHFVENNKIVGSVYCRIYNSYSAEIFGIISSDVPNKQQIEEELIRNVSFECQERGISNVTLFADLNTHCEMAESIGFVEVDTHLTFERKM